jgi:hypothetical protein
VTSIAFSVSFPFRKPLYRNYYFSLYAAALFFFAFFWICLNEVDWVQETFYVRTLIL